MPEVAPPTDDYALEIYDSIAPHIENGVTLAELERATGLSRRTLQRRLSCYLKKGLDGLSKKTRKDAGGHHLSAELITLIEGLYLRQPPPLITNVHRQVTDVCKQQGWTAPSYRVVRDVAVALPKDLVTLAQEGDKAYQQAFEIINRHEADR